MLDRAHVPSNGAEEVEVDDKSPCYPLCGERGGIGQELELCTEIIYLCISKRRVSVREWAMYIEANDEWTIESKMRCAGHHENKAA